MLPAHIKELIARLDSGSLTAFVEGLISAEAARLGTSFNNVVMSDQLTENDGGLDAIISSVPATEIEGPSAQIPPGLVGFQLKATRRTNPGAFELPAELRKPGPVRS